MSTEHSEHPIPSRDRSPRVSRKVAYVAAALTLAGCSTTEFAIGTAAFLSGTIAGPVLLDRILYGRHGKDNTRQAKGGCEYYYEMTMQPETGALIVDPNSVFFPCHGSIEENAIEQLDESPNTVFRRFKPRIPWMMTQPVPGQPKPQAEAPKPPVDPKKLFGEPQPLQPAY